MLGGTSLLPSTGLLGGLDLHPEGKSRISKPLEKTPCLPQIQQACHVNKTPFKNGTQDTKKGPSSKTQHFWRAKTKASWLKPLTPRERLQEKWAPQLCRDVQVWGTLAKLAGGVYIAHLLRIKKVLRPPALSFLLANKGTPTTIRLQNHFH